jgi:lysophospholipase L1-like esterase
LSSTKHLPGWKYASFAVVAVVLSIILAVAALLVLDVYLHKRFEQAAGLNIWGYRGPVAGRKLAGERRVAVLGGSTALGYGVAVDQSFPAHLERRLAERRPGPVSVVNLAYNNEGAYAFRFTLRDYAYLDYDLALLYTGYNDLGGANTEVFRHHSPIFRLTGYMPIFPIIFQEKAMALRHGGDLQAAFEGRKTVFNPNVGERMTATTLEVALRINQSLNRQLERFKQVPPESGSGDAGCVARWHDYCAAMRTAIALARGQGKKILVVANPRISDTHLEQQAALTRMLRRHFADDPNVKYADLTGVVDTNDRTICYDGMHLTAKGNGQIAEALVPLVLPMLD